LQEFKWGASRELGVILSHPHSKFEQWIKKEDADAGPVYV